MSRESDLKRKIAGHEGRIAKHRDRISKLQDKIYCCENELKEIEETERIIGNLGKEWHGCNQIKKGYRDISCEYCC